MSCWENLNIPSCVWFPEEKRNAICSLIAGILFFTGWWLIIDANVTSPLSFKGTYHLCGIFGTISLIMVNAMDNSSVESGFSNEGMRMFGARVWMFIGFLMGFAALIAACWILFADFVAQSKNSPETPVQQWAGVGLFLQNCFIFVASLTYKFGRVTDENQW